MSLLIKKDGILTTVQDLGRNGFRQFGINPNGAMD
jgi:allophanate hydrolase subunit 2